MPPAFSTGAGGGRSATCWLQDRAHEVPAELAMAGPGSGPGAGPGPGGTRPAQAPLTDAVQPAGAAALPGPAAGLPEGGASLADPAAVPPGGGASLPDAASTTRATGPVS